MKTANSSTGEQPIVIKKVKKVVHGHHGGAWKVAFADFVTAMMAFFLLMWLLAQTTPEERNAIQGYFINPQGTIVGQGGGLDGPGKNLIGPGGANTGVINMENPLTEAERKEQQLADQENSGTPDLDKASNEQIRREQAEREKESLDALQKDLEEQLAKDDSPFITLRDQILIDQTALGLRIQIVDKENRPMFDSGSSQLHEYAEEALYALAPHLANVPNKLSVNGHTDAVPFGRGAEYTNWELSADRANSARRALIDGDYPEPKILTVQGMGASVPRLPDEPEDASNRRIVILVLKKEVEEALRGNSIRSQTHEEFMKAGPALDIEPVSLEDAERIEADLPAE